VVLFRVIVIPKSEKMYLPHARASQAPYMGCGFTCIKNNEYINEQFPVACKIYVFVFSHPRGVTRLPVCISIGQGISV
jgi:hypothetical protein